jgi:hypothetical protein
MATGRLGTQNLTSGTITSFTNCYYVPANTYSVFNISCTNKLATACTVRIALSTSNSTPGAAEYLEYGTTIVGNGVFERTGLVSNAGLYVLVSTTSTDMAVNVYGIETSTT